MRPHALPTCRLLVVRRLLTRWAASSATLLLEMKSVDDTVEDGREENAGDAEEGETGVERVGCREQFAGRRSDFADRAHAAEQHRRIQEGVDGRLLREIPESEGADEQRG